MRITPKQFALSLYEAVEKKSPAQVKATIKKFVELLAERNSLVKAGEIIKEFEKIWYEENGIVEAEITSANGLSKEMIKHLKNYIKNLSGAKEVIASEKVDQSLLGGVVIRFSDKVIDGSMKERLNDLRSSLKK